MSSLQPTEKSPHANLWQNRSSVWDLAADEALLVTFLLLSNNWTGQDEDEVVPLYACDFNTNQAYQFVRMQMEREIGQHEQLLRNYDADCPYCYSREAFDKALESLCGRMGWGLDRETDSLSARRPKLEQGAER